MNLFTLFFAIAVVLLLSIAIIMVSRVKNAGKAAGVILCVLGVFVIGLSMIFMPASMWRNIGFAMLMIGIAILVAGVVLIVRKGKV